MTESEKKPLPSPTRPQPTPSEIAFGQGFRALRMGNHGDAAAHFELAVREAPAAPLAADARYWRAVALARAGDAGGARDALVDFLARHAGHARAGEASAMLGWMLLEAGDRRGASLRFRAALRDPDPGIRASAQKGLAALNR
jgi:TolA-binding protein